jgi:hypothetical protein
MSNLLPATYTQIERGSVGDTEKLVQKILTSRLPAFIIENSGISLPDALKNTAVDSVLRANGYDGNVKASVTFAHKPERVLSNELDYGTYFVDEEWDKMGVTSLHTDQHSDEDGRQFSLNHTRAGSSQFRLHPSRLRAEQLMEQWDLLDEQTGNLLWHSLVDPDLIAPEGHIATIVPGDLLVFDPSNAHVVRSLESPRVSEATFFRKVDYEQYVL